MSLKDCLRLLFFQIIIYKVIVALVIVDKGILPLIKNSIAIQFFIDVENKNHNESCNIYPRVKKCCLTNLVKKRDCDIINIYSEIGNIVKPRDRKTLKFVYPSPLQYDIVGYCNMILTYTCNKKAGKHNVHIPFDTRTVIGKRSNSLLKNYVSKKGKVCKTLDQDSLKKCSPTDCDVKYSGQRPFYDETLHRCVKAAICLSDDMELPNAAYVPTNNVCKDLDVHLRSQDIYALGIGLNEVTTTTEKFIKMKLNSNCSTISQNLLLIKDIIYGKFCSCDDNVDIVDGCRSAVFNIILNIISICAVLASFVCCIQTSVWVHGQWSEVNVKDTLNIFRIKLKRIRKPVPEMKTVERNILLREVIVKSIPIEMRDSAVSICDRMQKEMRNKRRYRTSDIGSQISLKTDTTVVKRHPSSNSTNVSDKQ